MLHLVSYDLIKPEKDYADLIAYLKSLGAKKVLLSEWLVESNLQPAALCDAIYKRGNMAGNDQILVVEVCNNAAWKPRLDISNDEVMAAFRTARC